MELGLEGKVALVTGASRGIGLAIARAFAMEGTRVALNARGAAGLEQAAASIREAGGDASAFPADVTDTEAVEKMAAAIVARFGTVHILINNAGGVGNFASFENLSDEDWRTVLDLNVLSAVRVTRAVLPEMRRNKWGRIINISSESAVQPDEEMAHYNASKAALNNLTKSLSKGYAADGILVNTVSPALIMTPLVEGIFDEQARSLEISREQALAEFLAAKRPHIELKRAGSSDEVARAVVFLASEQASFITGANLRVDGGSVAHM
jgi:NAD(P)-dependent dehydrogenase (short-subunit alcohol dehydrogenase family)